MPCQFTRRVLYLNNNILSTFSDRYYIQKCIELAEKGKGFVSPNPLVGCVILRDGKIIAEGYHHKFGDKHAEIDALDKIAGKAKGATLYVNLEPCSIHGKTPPCTDRIIKEGISRVVIGCLDKNPKVAGNGVSQLEASGIRVDIGVLEDKCQMLNQFFFKWISTGLPYVTLKIARTSDDFIAYPDGSCPHITGEESRKEVHELRSFYDSVLIGKNTALKDNPRLTVRKVSGRQPIRIVLDSHNELACNQNLHLLNDEYADRTWIIHEQVDLNDLIKSLGEKNISSILVEGGPSIWDSFMKAGLVDQIIVYTAPQKFGEGIKYSKFFDIKTIDSYNEESYSKGDDLVIKKFLRIY